MEEYHALEVLLADKIQEEHVYLPRHILAKLHVIFDPWGKSTSFRFHLRTGVCEKQKHFVVQFKIQSAITFFAPVQKDKSQTRNLLMYKISPSECRRSRGLNQVSRTRAKSKEHHPLLFCSRYWSVGSIFIFHPSFCNLEIDLKIQDNRLQICL